ncbi:MAG: zincin-like metallopeptidase domain-containing protein [Bryobacteraceae bacterium]|jgi:antirestriction protein ArdC
MKSESSQNGSRTTEPNKDRRDFRQEVTDQIVQMLESGTAPWQKPWKAGALGLPFNPTTENAYRGGNAVHLMATGLQRGYDDPRWVTYNQAAEKGWQVRKGEKATQIEYWEFPSSKAATPENPDKPADSSRDEDERPIHRIYSVFNAKQIEGIEPYRPKAHPEWEVVQNGEEILQNSGAKILHDRNDQAFYDRVNDLVRLPPKAAFPNAADYYGTALHELAHWSGHPDRLNRDTLTGSYQFGDTNYAKEELRAELASVFLAAEQGIPHNTERHAAYVGSWIQALKNDKNEIFKAAKDANRAADFLLALEKEKTVAEALNAIDPQVHRVAIDRGAAGSAETSRTQRRSQRQQADQRASGNPAIDQSFAEVKALSTRVLGDQTRVYNAQTDSGIYKGEIIGETQHHIVQRLSPHTTVAHVKHLMDTVPAVGDSVVLRYAGGKIDVTAFEPKALAKGLAR